MQFNVIYFYTTFVIIITQDCKLYCRPLVTMLSPLEVLATNSTWWPGGQSQTRPPRIQSQPSVTQTMDLTMFEKPCVMCNDKQGLGAPPKPKQQVCWHSITFWRVGW